MVWGLMNITDNDALSRDILGFKQSLHDNDVIRLVLERAKTVREGVRIVGQLVETYGQAWSGIMFEIGDPYESQLFTDSAKIEQQYVELKNAGKEKEGEELLTDFVAKKGDEALKAANQALANMTTDAAKDSAWEKR